MRIRAIFLALTLVAAAGPAGPVHGAPAVPAAPGASYATVPETLTGTIHEARPGRIALPLVATHLAWSWRGEHRRLEIKLPRQGWEPVAEAHDLETGSRHFSAVYAVGRISVVRWRWRDGSTAAATLDYINALDGPLQPVAIQERDQAGSSPDIVTRAEWGADESVKRTTGSCERRFFPVQQLFVHHTAGANYDTEPAATMRAIYWYHTVRRGWCDVGYNFVIGWDGTVYEGRWARTYASWEAHSSETRAGNAVAGAHVSGFNSGSVGISVMGNFSQADAPPAVRQSLAEMLAWESDRHDLDPQGTHGYRNPETGLRKRLPFIAGHRDAGQTSCPGDRLYRALPEVRRDTATTMGPGKMSSEISLATSTDRVDYGNSIELTGALVSEEGAPVGLQPVRFYVQPAGGEWAPFGDTTTGPDGSFALSLTPQTNMRVAAVYNGDSSRWGAQSSNVKVGVRPRVSLEASGGGRDDSGVVHFPPGTSSVTLSGNVEPAHAGHFVVLRVQQANGDGTYTALVRRRLELAFDGSYSYEFAIPGPLNVYRAISWFQSDGDHLSAPSPEFSFTVDQ